jgi:hypothetical protein
MKERVKDLSLEDIRKLRDESHRRYEELGFEAWREEIREAAREGFEMLGRLKAEKRGGTRA